MLCSQLVLGQVVLEEVVDPDCIPKPGEKPSVHARDCCDIRDSIPDSIKQAHLKCIEQIGLPPRPAVPTFPPPLEALEKFAAIDECVFQEINLLTADKQLDEEAVRKYFTSADQELNAAKQTAVDKCLSSYKAQVDSQVQAQSGAREFKLCYMREEFLNCPPSRYKGGDECDALSAKMLKCPNLPVFLGPKNISV